MLLSKPRLQATGIRKQFPGVLALDGVSLTLAPGEVLAVVGENGAGKSTLMKIVAGVYQLDAGTVELDGVPVRFSGPADATQAGIILIHQELNLAENLSVVDNLFLGREETTGGMLRILARRQMAHRGAELLARVGLPANRIHRRVETLAPGEKQLVEIARALGAAVRVLIMDEPTSSLTQAETDRLYDVIAGLKSTGVSVLFISHRLAEVKRCCDRVVVLRDGKNAGELAKAEIGHDAMVRLMVGRDMQQFYPKVCRAGSGGAAVLSLEGVRYRGGPPTPVSLEVRAGEILGMAGLVGAGRTQLSEAVFGVRAVTTGTIRLNGQPVRIASPPMPSPPASPSFPRIAACTGSSFPKASASISACRTSIAFDRCSASAAGSKSNCTAPGSNGFASRRHRRPNRWGCFLAAINRKWSTANGWPATRGS